MFEKIQAQILEEIESAEFLIWVAVAWFTDKTLFDALVKKRQLGISVKIILIDDNINKGSLLDFSSMPTKWLPPEGDYKNMMHHKFCVIDLKKVIHGSYKSHFFKFSNSKISNLRYNDNRYQNFLL
ncbi:MAG: phospholipase D-like domain-containing protein [Pleurocapsa sp.]